MYRLNMNHFFSIFILAAPCNCATAPSTPQQSRPQVAFTGTLSSSLSSLTTSTLLNFNGDIVNEGQPYDFRYDRFIAPVSGLYAFSLATYLDPDNDVYMELMQDASSIMYVKHGHIKDRTYDRLLNMGTNAIVVNITKGTEIWPRYAGGSAKLQGDGIPTFSGVLLQELTAH